MKRRHLAVGLPLTALLVLLPLAASADSHEMAPKPLTWISYVQSHPGQSTALARHIAEGGAKIYDGLMADGHVIHWGVAMPINHRPGDGWNIMEWVTFRDWAAVDTFMQGFMAMQMAKSPEQMKEEQDEWMSLVEPGSHHDAIYRHQLFVVGEGVKPPAYFNLSYHTAKPGQGEALSGLLKKYGKPVLSKLLADGKVGSYGIAVPEVHGGGGGTHVFWWGMQSLSAQEAVTAGFGAAAKERGEEAQKAVMKEFESVIDWNAHHDRILMVTHAGGTGGDKDAAESASGEGDQDGDADG